MPPCNVGPRCRAPNQASRPFVVRFPYPTSSTDDKVSVRSALPVPPHPFTEASPHIERTPLCPPSQGGIRITLVRAFFCFFFSDLCGLPDRFTRTNWLSNQFRLRAEGSFQKKPDSTHSTLFNRLRGSARCPFYGPNGLETFGKLASMVEDHCEGLRPLVSLGALERWQAGRNVRPSRVAKRDDQTFRWVETIWRISLKELVPGDGSQPKRREGYPRPNHSPFGVGP